MSKKRKKKGHHEEHVDESWLLPYSDLQTLLVALFIVLFASSSIDAAKFNAVSEAFNKELSGGTGIFEFTSPMPQKEMESTDETEESETKTVPVKDQITNHQTDKQIDQQELAEIQNRVNTYVQENNLGDRLVTSLTDEGLHVTIRDNVLFDSGRAEVRQEDLDIAREISNLLVMDPARSVIISGHTDNIPISNSSYASNWELSVMRAINFMKILLENQQLDPQLFSAKGYGEFQPISPNETAEGRASNRRVEILILPIESES